MNRWKKNRYVRPAINVNEVIDFMYDFFVDFKKKLKFNRFDRINMEVPRMIISKFKELFEIWDSNLMVSKSLEKDLFEEVYTSMADVFENYSTESSDHNWFSSDATSYMECEQCGEEIVLRNNNREYSVAYHNASRQHLDFVENFEKVRNNRQVEPVQPEERLKCDECDEEIIIKDDLEGALASHRKSLLHWERVNDKKINDIVFISQKIDEKGVPVSCSCHLCGLVIPVEPSDPITQSVALNIVDLHATGDTHVLNSYWLGLQSDHIKLHSKDENLIKCTLCDEIFSLDSFQNHFYAGSTSPHGRRMLLDTINIDNLKKSADKMKINFITRLKTNEGVLVECHICRVRIPASEENFSGAMNTHQDTDDHILNLYWLNLQNCYIKVRDRIENQIECTLCNESFRLDSFHSHFYAGSESRHGRRTLLSSIDQANLRKAVAEMNIDCISQVENNAGMFMRCNICRVLIPRPTAPNDEKSANKHLIDVVNLHQEEEDHLLNLYRLQSQSQYVEVYDRKQNVIRCTLCDETLHMDSFYYHFFGASSVPWSMGASTNQHCRRALLAGIKEKRVSKSSSNLSLND